MVEPCRTPLESTNSTNTVRIPTVDLSLDRSTISKSIVRGCEDYGIFKVVNHGVNRDVVTRLEQQVVGFFNKPAFEKLRDGPANPLGYGCKNIGCNGDIGQLEYLLLQANPSSISQLSKYISNHPSMFSSAVKDYIDEIKELTCGILDLLSEGLRIEDKYMFSRLVRDVQSDSMLRLNHYPTVKNEDPLVERVGFGEHSDPQILTILRSNDVPGLHICLRDGSWVPVPSDPTGFFVIVGDALQVMTNGRLVSVTHKALVLKSSRKERMSIMYFGAPPLHALISPLPEMVSTQNPTKYNPFTWAEYKKAAYSTRLADTRLDLFKIRSINLKDKIASLT